MTGFYDEDLAYIHHTGFTDLVDGAGPELLPGRSDGLRRRVLAEAAQRGIAVRLGARVAEVTAEGVRLEGGDVLPADSVLWAAGASAWSDTSRP